MSLNARALVSAPEVKASAADLAHETSERLNATLRDKIDRIQEVTRRTTILAFNATIEAARAGDSGKGFGIIAGEVRAISQEVEALAGALRTELSSQISELRDSSKALVEESARSRLVDLALNAVELIDRNLYERSCDVRWWATDAAVVDCASAASDEAVRYASKRLGVILSAYTVYIDLWLCDLSGNVIANGRPDRFRTNGVKVQSEFWFKQALQTGSGDDFVCADVQSNMHLNNAAVATYATAIRAGGEARGRPIGVLAVHFDWTPQAQTIVKSLRLSDADKKRTRALLLDSSGRVIAASDDVGVLSEKFPLRHGNKTQGSYIADSGELVGFSRTPGYETYQGMGWYGCLVQKL